MNDNISRFYHAFNELQDVVAKKMNKSAETNFGSLLGIARLQKDKVILSYMDSLDFFREFRNLLIHKTISGEEAIATPSSLLIEEIEMITEKIKHPKKVKDLFLSEVVTFDQGDKLSLVLKKVKEKSYSQFPVFNDNKLVGIVSENGITNFLANSISEDFISIKDITIEEVLGAHEEKRLYEVINENKSIFDIESIFNKRIKEGKTAYVLLISKNQHIKSPTDIVGIMTPWDIPEIVKNK
ncbi:MAG: CBS domain-containing protein [Carnobacterium sp.]|nr:CBS domain-containing protein [Carnobacterium sp.]